MDRLPAGRLARHAYLDTLANAPGLAHAGGPWLLLAWAMLLLGRNGSGMFEALANMVLTLGVAAIAVLWHRHILLGEGLTVRMAPLNARVARYFALTLLIALAMASLPLIALTALGGGAAALVVVPALVLACLYVALRVQLVFPATAIGDLAMTPGRSWALTRGNGWRLLGGFVLVTLPVACAAIGLTLLFGWASGATGSLVLVALADLAAVVNAWLQAPLIASFLSYAYIWFKERDPAA
jgi:hypothetical protein